MRLSLISENVHLGTDVNDELKTVDWNGNLGIFSNNKCHGALAMSPIGLLEYLNEKPYMNIYNKINTGDFKNLKGAQGEAFLFDDD